MPMFLMPNPAKLIDGQPVKVFDPERKGWLPVDGGAVPDNAYWLRRLADGDCITVGTVVPEPVVAAPAKKTAKKKGE